MYLVALQDFKEHMLLMAFLLICLHSHAYLWTEHILKLSAQHHSQFMASDKGTILQLEAVHFSVPRETCLVGILWAIYLIHHKTSVVAQTKSPLLEMSQNSESCECVYICMHAHDCVH